MSKTQLTNVCPDLLQVAEGWSLPEQVEIVVFKITIDGAQVQVTCEEGSIELANEIVVHCLDASRLARRNPGADGRTTIFSELAPGAGFELTIEITVQNCPQTLAFMVKGKWEFTITSISPERQGVIYSSNQAGVS